MDGELNWIKGKGKQTGFQQGDFVFKYVIRNQQSQLPYTIVYGLGKCLNDLPLHTWQDGG